MAKRRVEDTTLALVANPGHRLPGAGSILSACQDVDVVGREFDSGVQLVLGPTMKSVNLGGAGEVISWRPLQAEVVQPRKLPYGLLEARLAGTDRNSLFIAEISTYAEERVTQQVAQDLMMVYLDRRILPEAVILVLCRSGNVRVQSKLAIRSELGWSSLRAVCRVVELWNVPASKLFEFADVGVLPLVPLSKFAEPPQEVLRECRNRIDRNAELDERANLLAVSQVLTRLRFKDINFLDILGGSQAMIESPWIQETEAKKMHQALKVVLEKRFGPAPAELVQAVAGILDQEKLQELIGFAVDCKDLKAFRKQLREEKSHD